MKKHLKRAGLILLTITALLWGYARLVEQRSVASWGIERVLWLSGMKKSQQDYPEEKYAAYLSELQAISDQPFAKPKLSQEVTETRVDGMQVFTWNDKQDPNQKVLFYIHGGGYVGQPKSLHFSTVERIAKELDAKVVFPIYPKVPAYTYEDAFPKMEALYKQILSETADPQNITLMGDSAGGGFSLGFAMYARDHELPQPKDIILLSPWLDVATDNPEVADYEALDPMLSAWELSRTGELWANGRANMDNPYVSPIYGDFDGLGKISMFVGTHELFLPDNQKLHDLLTQQGIDHNYIEADKMNHVYAIYPIPEAKEAQEQMVDIIQQ
ncbi:alpha/beta hydrolase [Streptococcus caprae]|uniref:Alpha/beta hydrolase n=1 Tax=Streptococcus caprae TaxID=1640501 RepID=A0ABV8CT49_9STRE